MSSDISGFFELAELFQKVSDEFGSGGKVAKDAVTAAAKPVEDRMKSYVGVDPKNMDGNLKKSIGTGPVGKKNGGVSITIGVHRKDWVHRPELRDDEYYPAFVEFGHGGPRPAPPHPYVRPAFDATREEAYGIIRDHLNDALTKLK